MQEMHQLRCDYADTISRSPEPETFCRLVRGAQSSAIIRLYSPIWGRIRRFRLDHDALFCRILEYIVGDEIH